MTNCNLPLHALHQNHRYWHESVHGTSFFARKNVPVGNLALESGRLLCIERHPCIWGNVKILFRSIQTQCSHHWTSLGGNELVIGLSRLWWYMMRRPITSSFSYRQLRSRWYWLERWYWFFKVLGQVTCCRLLLRFPFSGNYFNGLLSSLSSDMHNSRPWTLVASATLAWGRCIFARHRNSAFFTWSV